MNKTVFLILVVLGIVAYFALPSKKVVKKPRIIVKNLSEKTIVNFGVPVKEFEKRSKSLVEGFKLIAGPKVKLDDAVTQLTKKDYLDTYVFSSKGAKEIPLIKFSDIEENWGFEEEGFKNYLIIHIEEAQDMDIVNKYDDKLYLDSDFFESDSKSKYFLFKDIQAANTTLKIRIGDKTYSYPLYVMDDAISFYSFEMSQLSRTLVHLKELKLLNTEADDVTGHFVVKNLHSGKRFERKSLSSFWKMSSSYFEVPMIKVNNISSIYTDTNIIKFPSVEFKKQILNEFEVDEFFEGCLVQINILDHYEKITPTFYTNESDYYESEYFDSDGQFYRNISERSKINFIMSDTSGFYDLDIKSKHGVRRIKFACKPGQYFLVN